MTQEETGNALGITQSQFSKMELGKTIVPYKALMFFIEMGWDVDYLVTGKKSVKAGSELSHLVAKAEGQQRQELLGAVIWLLKEGIGKCQLNLSSEIKCEFEILNMRTTAVNDDSVLYRIRKATGFSQILMAEKLGVNIKKYRMLEKNGMDPDAELLSRVFEVTGCRPSLILNHDHLEERIIDDIWGQMTPPVQGNVLALAEQVLCFIRM